jgi:spermidine synthase
MCEIDRRVVEVSKQFFGSTMATAFSDPRATVHYMDAAVYMKEHLNEFDVIIVDSSDPVGPAETLYTSGFYRDMYNALREGGVVCTQGECQFLHLELIKKVMIDAKAMYPVVDYAYASVPTYPDGQIGFIIATKSTDPNTLRVPKRAVPDYMKSALRYYSEEVHRSAFVLPAFSAKMLEGVRTTQGGAGGLLGALGQNTILAGAGLAALGAAAGFLFASRR